MLNTKNKNLNKGKVVKTVKFLFTSTLSIAMLVGTVIFGSENKSSIILSVDNDVVEAGKYFYVDIYADVTEPVNAIDFKINFDESRLSAVSVDKGESVFTIWTKEPEIKPTNVFVSGGTFKRGFIGRHKLVTVKFMAKQKGVAVLNVDKINFLAGDGSGRGVTIAEEGRELKLYARDGDNNLDEDLQAFLNNKKILTDIDGNDKVTLVDVSIFMSSWFDRDKIFDFNNDGKMTFIDFSIILADSFKY